jgi:UDP-GlcNAc:undecaprenyl-phosphate GlcNAc-1-phosphate transferase
MLITLLSVFTTLVISLVFTPLARRLAIRLQIFASPNHRTVHNDLTPKLGGLSIFAAFAIGLIIYAQFSHRFDNLWGLLFGGGFVLLVGLKDDLYHLSCYRKLLGQTVAAIIAVYFGFMTDTLYLPSGITLELGYWAAPLSVLWIVGITNAVNLLDGLDGLASGFTIVVALFVLLGAVVLANFEAAAIALILIAAAAGFLRYNLTPAKIFMGDSGSLFLGFALAGLSLKAFTVPFMGSHLAVMVVLFLVPLADTSLSIVRRISSGKHPFSPDKKHIHHRLLDLGLSQTAAVLIIYAATFVSGLFSLVLFVANFNQAIILLTGILLLSLLALVHLRSFDFLSKKDYPRKVGKYELN